MVQPSPVRASTFDDRADGHEEYGLLRRKSFSCPVWSRKAVILTDPGCSSFRLRLEQLQARRHEGDLKKRAFGRLGFWSVHIPVTEHDSNTMGWTKETAALDGRRNVATVSGQ